MLDRHFHKCAQTIVAPWHSPRLPAAVVRRMIGPTHDPRHGRRPAVSKKPPIQERVPMKLVRFGPRGREKPGIVDAKGRIRDLSKVVPDLAGDGLSPKSLAK